MHVGLLLFPKLTLLDLVGPSEVFARVPGAEIHLVWKNRDLVATMGGLAMQPTTTFAECPQLEVLCVPGGPGQVDLMEDEETRAFLRAQAPGAKWVTSVCTGSLILAAAGLLTGYRAACHWASLDQLALFDVIPVDERVVFDRNRVTGGGVTAGIDFALNLVAKMNGEKLARAIQLSMEYDPAPPFTGGSPRTAEPALVAEMRRQMEPFLASRRVVGERVAARLRGRA
jgi:cyclohexyl-isocyanide hydratase